MKMSKKEILKDFGLPIIKSKLVARNTIEIETPNSEIIRYYGTNIITKFNNGDFILDSGGYNTVTTKERINRFQNNIYLYQSDYIWYIRKRKFGVRYLFFDGIKFNKYGVILNPISKKNREINLLIYKINKFSNLLDKIDKLPKPNYGDCWICISESQGIFSRTDNNHLIEHINQGYLPGHLIYNTLLYKGLNKDQIWYVYYKNNKKFVKKYLRNYLKDRLIILK